MSKCYRRSGPYATMSNRVRGVQRSDCSERERNKTQPMLLRRSRTSEESVVDREERKKKLSAAVEVEENDSNSNLDKVA